MISNVNQSIDDYYDLKHNRITTRGFGYSDDAEDSKILIYPGILQNIYCITKDGMIYSLINDGYISWAIKNNKPYVNLSCKKDNIITLEPFYIKDLVAYNYIVNANNYLERGFHSVNVDGNPMNCNYRNIRYINSIV